jgi:hypothetical protein
MEDKMKYGELRFDSLKESRGWYFVEYAPPIPGYPFAMIQLTILNDEDAANLARVVSAMELELARWLARYSVPVRVTSFNAAGDLIRLEPEKPSDHLMGQKLESGLVESVWGLLDAKSLPLYSPEKLQGIYHDIPFRTGEQIRADAEESLKTTKAAVRWGIALLAFWLVIIPAGLAILGFANRVVGVLVLIYALWKAAVQSMKLIGKLPETTSERLEADKNRRMEHYFWHCERNPTGFQRLKMENFDREERERTIREAAGLRKP